MSPCKLLNHETCRCNSYKTRFNKVPDCVSLTPKEVRAINWLPPTCAYDLLAKGKDLYWWHPLVLGRSRHGAHGRRLGAR